MQCLEINNSKKLQYFFTIIIDFAAKTQWRRRLHFAQESLCYCSVILAFYPQKFEAKLTQFRKLRDSVWNLTVSMDAIEELMLAAIISKERNESLHNSFERNFCNVFPTAVADPTYC